MVNFYFLNSKKKNSYVFLDKFNLLLEHMFTTPTAILSFSVVSQKIEVLIN